jgi:hypothetical protein
MKAWCWIAGVAVFGALGPYPAKAQEFVQRIGGGDEHLTGGNAELPWMARDKFDRVRFMGYSSSHYVAKSLLREKGAIYVFLPPVSPPLDTEVPMLAPLESGPPAPPELAAFVGESFYPQLAYRMVTDELATPLRERILAYHDRKFKAQADLRSRIHNLGDSPGDKRERALAEFAALQKEAILGMESEGEKLAQELFPKPFTVLPSESVDPLSMMALSIRPPDQVPKDSESLHEEAENVRALAYFVEGLPSGLRRLLLECANDLENESDPGMESSITPPGMRLLSFSPEPARILVPQSLPASTEAAIEAYLSAKTAVKNDLRRALSRLPQEADKGALLRAITTRLAPEVADCNVKAEAIRHLLQEAPGRPGPPASPELPPDIVARISAYRRHKIEALRVLRSMLESPAPPMAGNGADAAPPGQAWIRDGTPTHVSPAQLRVKSADFESVQADLISKLTQEDQGIRASLARFMQERRGGAGPKDVNDLLREFENASQRQELWDQYRDYQAAALLPGLSDGQRRLLFDGAVESLGVALPAGVKIR